MIGFVRGEGVLGPEPADRITDMMEVIMKRHYGNHKIWMTASVGVILLLTSAAFAVQVVHSAGSDFAPGAFYQTVLEGSESARRFGSIRTIVSPGLLRIMTLQAGAIPRWGSRRRESGGADSSSWAIFWSGSLRFFATIGIDDS